MTMPSDFKLIETFRSPHFSPSFISVEFLIIHYTAQSFQGSLDIFLSQRGPEVSCHLLIDEQGKTYELVRCWDGFCQKAFHAGKSHWKDSEGKNWKNFNDFSIGIELVNWNGNLFSYTEKQYKVLFGIIESLKQNYPNLQKPYRILGHEHIAGFRGKVDPGALFDWKKLYKAVYQKGDCNLSPRMTGKQIQSLQFCKQALKGNDSLSRKISLILEKAVPFWIKKILIRNCL